QDSRVTMAQGTLALDKTARRPAEPIKQQTYWEAVLLKLWRDRISVFAILLLIFVVSISVAAPWIGENVLGFSPTKTNLRTRNEPPTWAEEAWPMFQAWTVTCQGEGGCEWSRWGPILRSAFTGLGQC